RHNGFVAKAVWGNIQSWEPGSNEFDLRELTTGDKGNTLWGDERQGTGRRRSGLCRTAPGPGFCQESTDHRL
ncbi:hypothetical protein, partial [uncultured Megasphaera sp.]|uniref:hypothetical protein n=1 Tax=uncultured Megasphaera sp. TaxID=165188 RepID=UPI0025E086AC